MSDDTTPLIAGDVVAAEMERYPRRRWGWRRKKQRPALTHCENCGAALTGRYCAKCGQAGIDYHRSFGTLLADAADAFLNLDERFLKTFVLLLFKPWRLTNEFLAGRRQRYVHPLRLYLIASVAFFFVIRGIEHLHPVHREQPIVIDGNKKNPEVNPAVSPAPSANKSEQDDVVAFDFPADDHHPKSKLGVWVENRVKEKIGPTGDRGDLFLKALIDNIGPMVLCCIPLFAFVLKILYIFKKRFYIEHLVFALHTHAFIFLSTLVIIGVGFFLNWKLPDLTPIVCVLLSFVVLAELLLAIRLVYRQNWFSTLFKFALGSAIYFVLLVGAFAVTAFLTLLLP
jgi:hypothetical protein